MTTPNVRRARWPRRPRAGFSLPELLISMVMIGIIGLALTRLIVTQSRFSNKQALQRSARGVARGALGLMESELRQVEQGTAFSGGTGVAIPAPTTTSITVNVPWAVGVRCTATRIAILPIDSVMMALGAASTVGVAWRNAATGRYVYDPTPSVVSGTLNTDFTLCTGAGITATGANAMPQMRALTISGLGLTGGTPGTPVMLFYRVRYRFAASTTVSGRQGLFRAVANSSATFGTEEELVAPFASTAGFRFFVGNGRTSTTTVPANLETIVGVQVNLPALSERAIQGRSTPEAATVSAPIFFRNRV